MTLIASNHRIAVASLMSLSLFSGAACGATSNTATRGAGTETTSRVPSTAASKGASVRGESASAIPDSSLGDWKRHGDAVIVGTVIKVDRFANDSAGTTKLYGSWLTVSVDKVVWGDPSAVPETLVMYGPMSWKTDEGEIVPVDEQGAFRLETDDVFVGAVTLAADDDRHSALTAPSAVIELDAGRLRPVKDAPEYQAAWSGKSIAELSEALKNA